MGANASVILTGGALPENIFWQVSGNATIASGATVQGVILCETDIEFGADAKLTGRALSEKSITMSSTTIQASSTIVLETINLGTAGDFVVLTKKGVATTGTSDVNGDMGTSPLTSAAITGFALAMDGTDTFSTSSQVTGKVYASDYAAPTPANLFTAITDMETAIADAAGRTEPDHTDIYDGDLTGAGIDSTAKLALSPGLYKFTSSVGFTDDIVFDGSSTDI